MANEVYAIDPTLVYDDPDDTPLDIKWNNIISLLVRQNQDNQVVIDQLVLQNRLQQDQIDELIRRLAYINPVDSDI
ncbi:hypothetical protein SARC_02249 [Sphaeroforma arctica JP610]|uniref:Uncharacterized protein n=1 Tax=Sphaeroforma arctica JP610 TaxID=667725 RepID=A0A0L0G9A6_9EUKA|nr:hypothetical protein SARC_02249 [Sphaeroforma arctica JP610]KNC85560.1 hypothetical protein SARC_02249 [Sphaeroforma arctica JP610]|eukprot:XP_014159462.1 hypothetical protein SARC_02249 [Sphaeroforma arctica JP610]